MRHIIHSIRFIFYGRGSAFHGLAPLAAVLSAMLSAMLFTVALFACSSPLVGANDEESIELPEEQFLVEGIADSAAGGCREFRICWSPAPGITRECRHSPGGRFAVTFRKNSPAAVLVYPENDKQGTALQQPLGLVYPYESSLTQEGAYAARLLWELYNPAEGSCGGTEAENVQAFNWGLFIQVCREKEAEYQKKGKQLNLYNLDAAGIKATIKAGGKFTKAKIKTWFKAV